MIHTLIVLLLFFFNFYFFPLPFSSFGMFWLFLTHHFLRPGPYFPSLPKEYLDPVMLQKPFVQVFSRSPPQWSLPSQFYASIIQANPCNQLLSQNGFKKLPMLIHGALHHVPGAGKTFALPWEFVLCKTQ